MRMCMVPVQEQRIRVNLEESIFLGSIFPKTEKYIFSSSKIQRELVRHMDTTELPYRCLLDCLFVNLFPLWKPQVRRFYDDEGELVIKTLERFGNSTHRIEAYELVMLTIALPMLKDGVALKDVVAVVGVLVP